MFVNLNEEQKEEKFLELINYAKKIKNISLKNACINILNDYRNDLFVRGAGHDGIENIKYNRTHQCFDGGLLDHMLNVTKNAYNIGTTYGDKVDMDLILFGAILHDIGKTKIFDKWSEENEIKSNLNYSYLLVDHVYLGEALVEKYLDGFLLDEIYIEKEYRNKKVEKYLNKENISEKLKYQALHIIATHMDTMEKHMAEAYIVSYADSIDADVENIISYQRNTINPILNTYIYESVNGKE